MRESTERIREIKEEIVEEIMRERTEKPEVNQESTDSN